MSVLTRPQSLKGVVEKLTDAEKTEILEASFRWFEIINSILVVALERREDVKG